MNALTAFQQADSASVQQCVHACDQYFSRNKVQTILDVGSRDAIVADALSNAYPQSIVYAFECNPAALPSCRSTCSQNARIRLIPKAVSDVTGKIRFFAIDPCATITPHPDGNIGASSLFKANPAYPFERYAQLEIEVDSIRLDAWALSVNVNSIDLLWMDIQGAELKALKGLGSLIRRTTAIFTEVSYRPVYLDIPLFPDVDRFLSERGFSRIAAFNTNEWFGDVLYVRT